MVLGGSVHFLEFLIGNSYISSGNVTRDRALEEKKIKRICENRGRKRNI